MKKYLPFLFFLVIVACLCVLITLHLILPFLIHQRINLKEDHDAATSLCRAKGFDEVAFTDGKYVVCSYKFKS